MIYFPDQLDRKQTDDVQGLLEPARESEGEHFSQGERSGMPGGILGDPFLMSEHLSVDEPLKCYHRRRATGEIWQPVCMRHPVDHTPWQGCALPLRQRKKAFHTRGGQVGPGR